MIDFDLGQRIAAMRFRVFRCIEEELQRDPMHKSYEGAIDVTCSFPNYFSQSDAPEWSISIHAYVLRGLDGRHGHWKGQSLADAVAKAEHGIDKICQSYEFARFEKAMNEAGNCDEQNERDGGTTYGPMRHEDDGRPEMPF